MKDLNCFKLVWLLNEGGGFVKTLDGLESLDPVSQIDALNDWIQHLQELREIKHSKLYGREADL